MVRILGLSAFYHDSAAALVHDGRVVAAAAEERFTRTKHDASFPCHAIDFCLSSTGITAADLDYVVFYEKPLRKLDRLLETFLAVAPRGSQVFCRAVPPWLTTKLHLRREINRHLGGQYRRRLLYAPHHLAHAASAFYQSPFPAAAVLTVDAVGEWATAGWGIGDGATLDWKQELRFPHSIGLLYSAVTEFCGFHVNAGEYELMGLAAYGEPRYLDRFKEQLVDVRDDGSFQLRWSAFAFADSLRMTDQRFEQIIGVRRRADGEPIRQVDRDLAASVQQLCEEILLKMAMHVHQQTGADSLCLAGGVMLNCVANGHLVRNSPFRHVWIQPAAGDDGGAVGAALWVNHQVLANPRVPNQPDAQAGSLLGPSIHDDEVHDLQHAGAILHRDPSNGFPADHVAQWLSEGKVVGVASGPMEFGPRALGNRSILADPRDETVRDRINHLIKSRASFRPFAPAVLKEHASTYFDLPEPFDSPYMLICCNRRPDASVALPAVTHVDGSVRLQTVDAGRHPTLHLILSAFYQRTGCPVLLNTSFNTDGQPIVSSARDAYRCFRSSGLDAVVIGNHWAESVQQPEAVAGVWPEKNTPMDSERTKGAMNRFLLRLVIAIHRVRFALQTALLLGLYVLLLTPIGLVRRRMSDSSFQTRWDPRHAGNRSTFWRTGEPAGDPSSAFRRY